ncbi:DUF5928 domain-containing protein [Paracoccus pacificus]|uniref:Peptide O-xylosyltransferase n=1 Tax=Paracoccus pacificus TaxID=1463598 RepID=A0ABW4R6U0_9RHOB
MARIAFILLAHKDPAGVIAQAERLTEAGDFVAIHFDGRSPTPDFERIRTALSANSRVCFARRRIKCGWGGWSLVAATLAAVRAATQAFPTATHFYMLSGDCMPTKSARYAHDFLDANDVDYIENVDFFNSGWIKTGFRDERLIYRHWFNERRQKKLFYISYEIQRRLGLTRTVPAELDIRIGSQWWCLRRQTIESVLNFVDSRPDIIRFFSTTWIPDETFFQTLVPHIIPRGQIRNRTLTFLMFTDYGMPVTFYNDHYDLLIGQDYLFARKISAEALDLRERLGALWNSDETSFAISNEGRGLYRFLTGRGRAGRRFAPRFWEKDSSVGRQNQLMIVVCKKWHVAKRLTAGIRARSDLPAVDFLFNESGSHLPDLGGIDRSLSKLQRHRRAAVRMLFEHYGKSRLVICLDTSNLELVRDFMADKSNTRILLIDSDFDDDYLRGHLQRVGLVGETISDSAYRRLIPIMRADLQHEAELLSDLVGPALFQISRYKSDLENAEQLSGFLGVDNKVALELAQTTDLFRD